VRVLTLNVFSHYRDWRARCRVLAAGLRDLNPDVVALQETSIPFWTGRQSLDGVSVYYQDAWEAVHGDAPGHTFTPDNRLRSDAWRPRPGRRIDYVMVRCGDRGATLDITNCEVVFDQPVEGVWGSDLFGVFADREPRPASETCST
jgi:endonuclease/exonuclease/phosphatase family metal-dependent hydrolase